MAQVKSKTGFNIAMLLLVPFCCFAQTEYLSTVNPSTGAFNLVNDLPNVKFIAINPNFTTFDGTNKRYIFKGLNEASTPKLYTIDAVTGNIIYNPDMPVFEFGDNSNLIEFQYGNTANTLYGLHWNATTQMEYFVSVNPQTSAFTDIKSIPGVVGIASFPHFTIFDQLHQRYIFKGIGDDSVSRLYSIDVITGDVVSSPDFPVVAVPNFDQVVELQYDNVFGKIYGFFVDTTASTINFATVNPATGVHTIISTLTGFNSIETNNGYTSYDEINHHYIFNALGPSGWGLYTINAQNGSVISYAPFSFPVGGDNVIEMQFDNTSGNLYALHWEAVTLGINDFQSKYFTLSPNPMTSQSEISLNKPYSKIHAEVFDLTGKHIKSIDATNTQAFSVDRENLSSGTYLISITADMLYLGGTKMIVQ